MICIFIILTLSLALIVLMGGLFLLAYSKKEGLGWLSKITSYIAVTFGSVLFVGCIVACLMCKPCGKSSCGKNQESCGMRMQKDCSGNSCGKGMMGGHHRMGEGSCEYSNEACCKDGKKDMKMKVMKKDTISE